MFVIRFPACFLTVGTEVEGKQVVPAKRFLDDKFPDLGQDLCLDCCGAHPCCHDCGLGGIIIFSVISSS